MLYKENCRWTPNRRLTDNLGSQQLTLRLWLKEAKSKNDNQEFMKKAHTHQWRSQNAESTHIKGRLLDQAKIHFNCTPFQNANFSYRKEFAPRGSEFFPL